MTSRPIIIKDSELESYVNEVLFAGDGISCRILTPTEECYIAGAINALDYMALLRECEEVSDNICIEICRTYSEFRCFREELKKFNIFIELFEECGQPAYSRVIFRDYSSPYKVEIENDIYTEYAILQEYVPRRNVINHLPGLRNDF